MGGVALLNIVCAIASHTCSTKRCDLTIRYQSDYKQMIQLWFAIHLIAVWGSEVKVTSENQSHVKIKKIGQYIPRKSSWNSSEMLLVTKPIS